MKMVFLDGSLCKNRDEFHFQLKEKLDLPDYYGMNLDALYDCVSTMKDTHAVLIHWESLVETLGHYGQLLIQTMTEASEENPGFEFRLEDDYESDV